MHYPEDKETSGELLRLVLSQISRHGSGFQPPSYALWYEYVAAGNPPLQRALDARIAQGGALSDEETHSLHSTYVAARDAKALDELSGQLQLAMQELGRLASSAGNEANRYGQSLTSCGKQLTPQLDLESLRGIIGTLAGETTQMRQSNQALSERLQASEREFVELKTQLATVQCEALLDPLTKLSNRRGFQHRVDELLSTRADGLLGCALVMADIDHFKKVNDTHGHLLGDRVLQAVAQALRANVKGRDVAARFGGEEFAILLPDTPARGAAVLAEQLRQTVAQGRIRRADRDELIGGVTVSFGVSAYRPGETLEQWIDRTDQALYASKNRGRNCVTLAAVEPATV